MTEEQEQQLQSTLLELSKSQAQLTHSQVRAWNSSGGMHEAVVRVAASQATTWEAIGVLTKDLNALRDVVLRLAQVASTTTTRLDHIETVVDRLAATVDRYIQGRGDGDQNGGKR